MYRFTLEDCANLNDEEKEQLKALAGKAGVEEDSEVLDIKAHLEKLNKMEAEEKKWAEELSKSFC